MKPTQIKTIFVFRTTVLTPLPLHAPTHQLRFSFWIRREAHQPLNLLHFALRLPHTTPHLRPCPQPDNYTTKNHGTPKPALLCGMTMVNPTLLALRLLQTRLRNTSTKCLFARMTLRLENRIVEGQGHLVCWASRPPQKGDRAMAPILQGVQSPLPNVLALLRGAPGLPASTPGRGLGALV